MSYRYPTRARRPSCERHSSNRRSITVVCPRGPAFWTPLCAGPDPKGARFELRARRDTRRIPPAGTRASAAAMTRLERVIRWNGRLREVRARAKTRNSVSGRSRGTVSDDVFQRSDLLLERPTAGTQASSRDWVGIAVGLAAAFALLAIVLAGVWAVVVLAEALV